MASLEASSGAAPVSQQQPSSALLRAGAGRRRKRYHPPALSRQSGAVASGGRPVGTVMGRSGVTGAQKLRIRWFAAIARVDLVSVDFA